MGMVGVLVFWASPIGIPAFAILWVRATDFTLPGAVELQALPGEQEVIKDALYVAGFPLSLQLFTMMCITAYVLLRLSLPYLGRPGRARVTFGLWIVLLLLTVISAFWGRSIGNENWTQPLRASMALATFFYGLAMAPKFVTRQWVMEWMLWIVGVVLLLLVSGLYWNHIAFFYIGVASFAFWHIKYRRRRLLAVALVVFCVLLVVGPRDTLTILAIVVGGLSAGFFLFHRDRAFARSFTIRWTNLVIPFSFAVIVVAILMTPSTMDWYISRDASVLERLQFKLSIDRGTLWRATWDKIVTNPQLISPAGTPLLVDHPITRYGDGYWRVHIHNSYLEMLRQTGILGGVIFVLLVILLWYRLRDSLFLPFSPTMRLYGGAALITIAIGALTGFFPFDFFAGPWVWLYAGLVAGSAQLYWKAASDSRFVTPHVQEVSALAKRPVSV